jgi:CheY-like chemotaxis protein
LRTPHIESAAVEHTGSRAPRSEPAPRRSALLLDDEEAILLPTATYFRSLGFAVDMAREPEEAEALVQHHHYDLAVVDLRVTPFGGAQGLDVLREIKRRQPRTSVIVLSAYISPELEAWALGADGVLSKPQSLPVLARLALGLMGGAR